MAGYLRMSAGEKLDKPWRYQESVAVRIAVSFERHPFIGDFSALSRPRRYFQA